MEEVKYCVYSHLDDSGITFYIGIGNAKRPYDFIRRSKFWKNYVEKHCASGKPRVQIDHTNLSWEQAVEHEKFWIGIYGRKNLGTGCLVNLTSGGDGAVGAVRSEKHKRKIGDVHRGKRVSEVTRKKMSEAAKNRSPETKRKIGEASKNRSPETKRKLSEAAKNISAETRRKMSEAKLGKTPHNLGKSPSTETRQKMSLAHFGKPSPNKGKKLSEEHRRKIGDAQRGNKNTLGKKHSEEHKRKISEANRGKTLSPETRQKIGDAQRGKGRGYYFDKRRQKWQAQVSINGKNQHLGYFTFENDAAAAYKTALGKTVLNNNLHERN